MIGKMFNPNKRYRFSKELFEIWWMANYKRYYSAPSLPTWVAKIDGREACLVSNNRADINGYEVMAEWCEEINDG